MRFMFIKDYSFSLYEPSGMQKKDAALFSG